MNVEQSICVSPANQMNLVNIIIIFSDKFLVYSNVGCIISGILTAKYVVLV